MKRNIIMISCMVLGLGLTHTMEASINRGGLSRSGLSGGYHSAGNTTHNKEFFSVGHSGEHSNQHGSVTHTGSTSNQYGDAFHEGTTTVSTDKGSITHDGTSSKEINATNKHQGSIKVESSGDSSASHYGNTSYNSSTGAHEHDAKNQVNRAPS